MFAVEFILNPGVEFGEPERRGRITPGEFSEVLIAPLVSRATYDYLKQWVEAAERTVKRQQPSCFVAARARIAG
jgi:hypothetical protein